MAYASVTYTSASGTTFALTNTEGNAIEYLRQADISVAVNGTTLTQGTDYTFNSAGTSIILTSAVSSATVAISRLTTITDATVSFTAGSTLTAQDLNNSDRQNRFALQEFSDLYAGLESGTGDLGALGGFIDAGETWVSDDGHAATTNAIDNRIDTKVDAALTGDVAAGNAITITDNSPGSGQITIAVTDGAIDTAELTDNAVTTAKITGSAVTTAKIADSNVTTAKIADSNVTTAKINDAAVTTAKIADSAVTNAKIASGVDGAKITDGTITSAKLTAATVVINSEVPSVTVNDTSFFTTSASDRRYFRQDSTETISSGDTWSGSDSFIATTGAIDARIIDLVDDVGGFVPIANETSFPTTNPDINNPDGAGTIISVQEIVTTRTPSGGSVTIANGAGSNTVTITGLGTTSLPAGYGVLVETTSTLHTYAFHRLTPKATEVTTVAGISTDVTTVAGISANVTTVADNNANVTTVATDIANINTVAADLNEATSEIDTVATNIANVNTVGNNITNVNTVAGNNTNINTVAGLNTDIGTLADIEDGTTATDAISTVAGISANVTTVAGISANVTSVAGNNTDISTVADDISNVNTVADDITNVNTVATNITNVNNASTYLNNFLALYLGSLTSDPSTDTFGNAVTNGDLYFNSNDSQIRVYNGSDWQSFAENAFGSTVFADATFSAVYTAAAGSNTIDLGSVVISGAAFADENTPTNRMSLALGSGSFDLGSV